MAKIFLYCDKEHEPAMDNVFLSGVYKDVGEFKRQNPEYRPLISYNAQDTVKLLNKQLKEKLAKKPAKKKKA